MAESTKIITTEELLIILKNKRDTLLTMSGEISAKQQEVSNIDIPNINYTIKHNADAYESYVSKLCNIQNRYKRMTGFLRKNIDYNNTCIHIIMDLIKNHGPKNPNIVADLKSRWHGIFIDLTKQAMEDFVATRKNKSQRTDIDPSTQQMIECFIDSKTSELGAVSSGKEAKEPSIMSSNFMIEGGDYITTLLSLFKLEGSLSTKKFEELTDEEFRTLAETLAEKFLQDAKASYESAMSLSSNITKDIEPLAQDIRKEIEEGNKTPSSSLTDVFLTWEQDPAITQLQQHSSLSYTPHSMYTEKQRQDMFLKYDGAMTSSASYDKIS